MNDMGSQFLGRVWLGSATIPFDKTMVVQAANKTHQCCVINKLVKYSKYKMEC